MELSDKHLILNVLIRFSRQSGDWVIKNYDKPQKIGFLGLKNDKRDFSSRRNDSCRSRFATCSPRSGGNVLEVLAGAGLQPASCRSRFATCSPRSGGNVLEVCRGRRSNDKHQAPCVEMTREISRNKEMPDVCHCYATRTHLALSDLLIVTQG
jgi:hypothetical protein